METVTKEEEAGARLAPTAVRSVIQQVAAQRVPLTPESFSAAYVQWAKQHGIPVEVQYTSELAVLQHALAAFADLLVGNPWLNGRYRAVSTLTRDARVDVDARTRGAKQLLNEVMAGKASVLFDATRSVADVRRIVREVLTQVQELAYHLNVSQSALSQALARAEAVGDMTDLRKELQGIAATVKRLNRAMLEGRERLTDSAREYASTGQAVFGTPRPETARAVIARRDQA